MTPTPQTMLTELDEIDDVAAELMDVWQSAADENEGDLERRIAEAIAAAHLSAGGWRPIEKEALVEQILAKLNEAWNFSSNAATWDWQSVAGHAVRCAYDILQAAPPTPSGEEQSEAQDFTDLAKALASVQLMDRHREEMNKLWDAPSPKSEAEKENEDGNRPRMRMGRRDREVAETTGRHADAEAVGGHREAASGGTQAAAKGDQEARRKALPVAPTLPGKGGEDCTPCIMEPYSDLEKRLAPMLWDTAFIRHRDEKFSDIPEDNQNMWRDAACVAVKVIALEKTKPAPASVGGEEKLTGIALIDGDPRSPATTPAPTDYEGLVERLRGDPDGNEAQHLLNEAAAAIEDMQRDINYWKALHISTSSKYTAATKRAEAAEHQIATAQESEKRFKTALENIAIGGWSNSHTSIEDFAYATLATARAALGIKGGVE